MVYPLEVLARLALPDELVEEGDDFTVALKKHCGGRKSGPIYLLAAAAESGHEYFLNRALDWIEPTHPYAKAAAAHTAISYAAAADRVTTFRILFEISIRDCFGEPYMPQDPGWRYVGNYLLEAARHGACEIMTEILDFLDARGLWNRIPPPRYGPLGRPYGFVETLKVVPEMAYFKGHRELAVLFVDRVAPRIPTVEGDLLRVALQHGDVGTVMRVGALGTCRSIRTRYRRVAESLRNWWV